MNWFLSSFKSHTVTLLPSNFTPLFHCCTKLYLYSILTHIYGIQKDGNSNPICKTEKETQMYRTDFWALWEKARVGWSEGTASKHVYYYQVWNRSPVRVGCMRQVLRAGALGWPRGMGWGGRWEGGSRRGAHVNPWLIHVNVWQKPLQYCKVINLQLIKVNEKNYIFIFCA